MQVIRLEVILRVGTRLQDILPAARVILVAQIVEAIAMELPRLEQPAILLRMELIQAHQHLLQVGTLHQTTTQTTLFHLQLQKALRHLSTHQQVARPAQQPAQQQALIQAIQVQQHMEAVHQAIPIIVEPVVHSAALEVVLPAATGTSCRTAGATLTETTHLATTDRRVAVSGLS